MKLLDLTLPSPAENLACDEALLDWCEEGNCAEEILRFWEPAQYFVVVGYANHIASEVNRQACEAKGIPILRRCSGGGTVVQGPGCLNYTLILKVETGRPLEGITTANRFIMERNCAAIELIRPSSPTPRLPPLSVQGHTDLALAGRKFSGNAQRRKRRFLLFHGTFLLDFDLALMGKLLPMPSRQPDYRQSRDHEEFLTNLLLPASTLKLALARAWEARESLQKLPNATIGSLARNKYATQNWNFKF